MCSTKHENQAQRKTVSRDFHGVTITVDILTSATNQVSFWMRYPDSDVRVRLEARADLDEFDEALYCAVTHVDEYGRYAELRVYEDGAAAVYHT